MPSSPVPGVRPESLASHESGQARFADELSRFESKFARNGEPIHVNFRKLAGRLSFDRLTHLIHPYPAKLLPLIPHYLLQSQYFAGPGAVVLDPFCGSGTVLLEARVNGQMTAGADSNPLARLITRVKTTAIDLPALDCAIDSLLKALRRSPRKHFPAASAPDVVNIDYWFSGAVQHQLQNISWHISRQPENDIRDFLQVALSHCVRSVSFADPRLSVPVRLSVDKYATSDALRHRAERVLQELKVVDVSARFGKILIRNRRRLAAALPFLTKTTPSIDDDARSLALPDRSVDLVLTSPPYVGAQKYIRASSLSLGWLGLASRAQLRILEDKNIGREHYLLADYRSETVVPIVGYDVVRRISARNPLRGHIAATYLVEIADAIREAFRVLRRGGTAIIIVANNTVAGVPFNTVDYISELAARNGAQRALALVDGIRGRGLMTTRNGTAGLISHEWVLVFRKPS